MSVDAALQAFLDAGGQIERCPPRAYVGNKRGKKSKAKRNSRRKPTAAQQAPTTPTPRALAQIKTPDHGGTPERTSAKPKVRVTKELLDREYEELVALREAEKARKGCFKRRTKHARRARRRKEREDDARRRSRERQNLKAELRLG